MAALMTIAAVLAMYVFVYYLVTWVNRIRSSARVQCPVDGKEYEVELEHRTGDFWQAGRAVDVIRCAAFADPTQVACGKTCLKTQVKSAPPT